MAPRFRRTLVVVGLIITSIAAGLATTPAATADGSYQIAWTEIGIYPRTGPSMDTAHASPALSDGSTVEIACETTGEAVSNGYTVSEIWAVLADGTFLPNAFINTQVDGWTPGIERCDEAEDETDQPTLSDESDRWTPYCGPSKYFSSIEIMRWANGDFEISAAPTAAARTSLDPSEATIEEWHAIQECVSGLEGDLADSIWDQLACHQHLALVPDKRLQFATGDTYDLESWRGTFPDGLPSWIANHCGNELNKNRNHSDEPVFTGSPDAGLTDLAGAWDGIS